MDRATVLELARGIALSDAERFAGWFPGHKDDPQGWTWRALAHHERDRESHVSYALFLSRMVYGERTEYAEAFRSVSELGTALWRDAA